MNGSNPQRLDLKRHWSNYWSEMLKMHPLFAVPQWSTQCLMTFDTVCTRGLKLSAQASCTHRHLYDLHRLDIKPPALDLIILLHQGTRLSKTLFYLNPLSKAKEHSAGAKRNRRQGFQKGLVTNRSNPGLFTHRVNTAASCNRLKSVHVTKWNRVPECKS